MYIVRRLRGSDRRAPRWSLGWCRRTCRHGARSAPAQHAALGGLLGVRMRWQGPCHGPHWFCPPTRPPAHRRPPAAVLALRPGSAASCAAPPRHPPPPGTAGRPQPGRGARSRPAGSAAGAPPRATAPAAAPGPLCSRQRQRQQLTAQHGAPAVQSNMPKLHSPFPAAAFLRRLHATWHSSRTCVWAPRRCRSAAGRSSL